MQRKILKISALLLCLSILLLATPSTFAKDVDKPQKLESRFLFVNPAALLSGFIWDILPPSLDHTTIIVPIDKDTTLGGTIKTCGDLHSAKPSEDG